MDLVLNVQEMEAPSRQAPETGANGGWQSLLVGIQQRCDRPTGRLQLRQEDLQRIPRYAFDYGNGGWEKRLTTIFHRHLGPNLTQ